MNSCLSRKVFNVIEDWSQLTLFGLGEVCERCCVDAVPYFVYFV